MLSYSIIALRMKISPKNMNRSEVPIFMYFSGSNLRSFAPRITPIPVTTENASMMPANTMRGFLSSAAKTIDASCVLSPSS